MKIAVMVGTLRTPLDEGTGKSVVNLAKELDKHVDEAFIFTRDSNHKQDNLPREEFYQGVRIVRRPITPGKFFHNRKVMNAEEVDLVHVHTSSAKMALYASKLASNSLWTIPAYRSSSFDEKLWQLFARQTSVATSKDLKESSPAEEVLPYGIDTENYRVDRTPDRDNLKVLYMGAPNEKRGFFSAIQTVKHLSEEENIKFHVAVRERDNQEETAKEIIEEEGISDITTVRGFIDDLPDFYNSIDILLNPIKDASGVTSPPVITLEAMSCGRVACCTDIPDFANLIEDNESGLLFEYGDEKTLAERILNLSNSDIDNISANAREKIKSEYSWDYITEEYLDIYEEIING